MRFIFRNLLLRNIDSPVSYHLLHLIANNFPVDATIASRVALVAKGGGRIGVLGHIVAELDLRGSLVA